MTLFVVVCYHRPHREWVGKSGLSGGGTWVREEYPTVLCYIKSCTFLTNCACGVEETPHVVLCLPLTLPKPPSQAHSLSPLCPGGSVWRMSASLIDKSGTAFGFQRPTWPSPKVCPIEYSKIQHYCTSFLVLL